MSAPPAESRRDDDAAVVSPPLADTLKTLTEDDPRPPLLQDRSYWGLLVTQFLGAFNDNFYKQFVLLLCIDLVAQQGRDDDPYQTLAVVVFALPFVLFSLYTGAVADRYSKRSIAVLCKAMEIVVMLAGTAVLASFAAVSPPLIYAAIAVIALMSLQSTLFSPAKYGILPELFRAEDLPRVNGGVQMSTFVAIVLGVAAAGLVKGSLDGRWWIAGLIAVCIAVAGTLTSLLIRKTPPALPGVPFSWASFVGDPIIWRRTFSNPALKKAILVYSLFFLLGALVLPTVNTLGKMQLDAGDFRTSLLAMMLSLGMGVGCFVAGYLGRTRNRLDLVVVGSLGLLAAGGAIAALTAASLPPGLTFGLMMAAIGAFGAMAGLTAVPLQVVIQSTPAAAEKGRTIGVQNLCTWIGILIGGAAYFVLPLLFGAERIGLSFALIGLLMLPAAWAYRREIGVARA